MKPSVSSNLRHSNDIINNQLQPQSKFEERVIFTQINHQKKQYDVFSGVIKPQAINEQKVQTQEPEIVCDFNFRISTNTDIYRKTPVIKHSMLLHKLELSKSDFQLDIDNVYSYYPFLIFTERSLTIQIPQTKQTSNHPITDYVELINLDSLTYNINKIYKQCTIVDCQFDTNRENSVWMLLYFEEFQLYDCRQLLFNPNTIQKQLLSNLPVQILKQMQIKPSISKEMNNQIIKFQQYKNVSLNEEYLFFFSPSKMLIYINKSTDTHTFQANSSQQNNFKIVMITPFIDLLGMKRLMDLQSEQCDVTDYTFLSKQSRSDDVLRNYEFDEASLFADDKQFRPLVRNSAILDIDDQIVILPDFISQKLNQLIVMPIDFLSVIQMQHENIRINEDRLNIHNEMHKNKDEDSHYTIMESLEKLFEEQTARIIEDGQLTAQSIITQVQIFENQRCMNGINYNKQFKLFSTSPYPDQQSQSWDKLLIVANLKSVSFWAVNLNYGKNYSIYTQKLANIIPFTHLSYGDKLSITSVHCENMEVAIDKQQRGIKQIEQNQDFKGFSIEVNCFTTVNKIFKFNVKLT
eukprot:403348052